MPRRELVTIRARHVRQRYAQRVRGDREAPEDVAKLLRESSGIDLSILEYSFPHQAENLGGFFRQPSARVEKTVAVVERRIERSERGLLVGVEVHFG